MFFVIRHPFSQRAVPATVTGACSSPALGTRSLCMACGLKGNPRERLRGLFIRICLFGMVPVRDQNGRHPFHRRSMLNETPFHAWLTLEGEQQIGF